MTIAAPHPQWIVPAWPAPPSVRALITTRAGGVSQGPFGDGDLGGMNVGLASGDAIGNVNANRELLRRVLPAAPRWLHQVHGARVVRIDAEPVPGPADAAVSLNFGYVCAVSVADCLPVLLADLEGRAVGIAHAGWRGLAAGIIQKTVAVMRSALGRVDTELLAHLGPAIGPQWFEVGEDVLVAMNETLPQADAAFTGLGSGKYLCDLPALARQALSLVHVDKVTGGNDCTYSDPRRFFSYRRDGVTGRHAALVWREEG